MIGYLKGCPVELRSNYVLILAHGVGYQVKISLNTFSALSSSDEVELFVHTYVREDRIELYGFKRMDEKKLFEALIRVNGVGPNVALAILSGLTVEELVGAVRQRHSESLVRIPGIGKTKAEKIILDMQSRIKDFNSANVTESDQLVCDAIDSLVALGFDYKQASRTVSQIYDKEGDYDLEKVIRKALANIRK